MNINVDLNELYCENGQWKVALNSKYNGLTKQETIQAILKDALDLKTKNQKKREDK